MSGPEVGHAGGPEVGQAGTPVAGRAAAREELLAELRPAAFAVAYRMLGSVSEAEDLVQEALLRLHRAIEAGEHIESPRAYLATVTTRLAIDELRSARARRERYVGEWLPEPILTEDADDPAVQAEMADSLSLAMLVLLETLSPEQRAVLLLHDVFDYSYEQVAGIVEKSEPAVRQLASRARKHLEARRPRFEARRQEREELARRFFAAVREGEVEPLEELLAHDVALHGDGGGNVPALGRPLFGRSSVARALLTWVRQGSRIPGAGIRPAEVNGQPGAVLLVDGQVIGIWSLDIADGHIQTIRSIINPDKLRHLGPVADMREALRRRV